MRAARHWWPAGATVLFLIGCWLASVPLARLSAARAEHRALLAIMSAALPPAPSLIPQGRAIRSGAVLAGRLRAQALMARILVERVGSASAGPRLVATDIAVSGGEAAVLGFVQAAEGGAPAVRFVGWRIEALPGGAIRFHGRAVAGW